VNNTPTAAKLLAVDSRAPLSRRVSVDSDNLRSIGFNPRTLELSIRFWSGPEVYVFRNVPVAVHKRLMEAPSYGEYFAAHVKNVYPFTLRKP
jgi:hypothetical protein